ncbi:hypothetical protein [Streptomyces luteoverticillatus]|uniref:hypothetical protein n=1 Tax=Streptomyces luteoverticillatus TaxID=66425 RepID=UPI003D35B2B6
MTQTLSPARTTARIVGLGTAVPAFSYPQQELLDIFSIEDPRIRSVFLNSAIERRFLTLPPELPDGTRHIESQGELLRKHEPQGGESEGPLLQLDLTSCTTTRLAPDASQRERHRRYRSVKKPPHQRVGAERRPTMRGFPLRVASGRRPTERSDPSGDGEQCPGPVRRPVSPVHQVPACAPDAPGFDCARGRRRSPEGVCPDGVSRRPVGRC